MSILILKGTLSKKTAAAETDQPMLTPEEAAEQFRSIRLRIPELVHMPNNAKLRRMRREARVNAEFSREAIGTVEASAVVQGAIGNTPEEFYEAEDELVRWTVVEAELRALLQGVTAANMVRRHRIGLAALQVFNISRELARREQHAELLPYVQAMNRIPRFVRRRVKAPVAPADPAKKPQEPASTA